MVFLHRPRRHRTSKTSQDSDTTPRSPMTLHAPLHSQCPVFAPAATKIRLSMLATAMVDALGGPTEFQRRFCFPLITTMIPNENFRLPPGVWTDDTSMTLCLAHSLATFVPPHPAGRTPVSRGGFNEIHQLEAYYRWYKLGELSATGKCFDIGTTIRRALDIFSRSAVKTGGGLQAIAEQLRHEKFSGNGSLMRILPIGLVYWRNFEDAARYAIRSSETTHPNDLCLEACALWTHLIARIMERSGSFAGHYSKLHLLDYIATFRYKCEKLREVLAIPATAPPRPSFGAELEDYYFTHHPLLRLIEETQREAPSDTATFPYCLPTEEALPSTGYVLHTLVAALYCFFTTNTFETGAIMAANLGSDADTVGAVYGGLAGCWYGSDKEQGDGGMFWTERVEAWQQALARPDLLHEVTEELVEFAESQDARH